MREKHTVLLYHIFHHLLHQLGRGIRPAKYLHPLFNPWLQLTLILNEIDPVTRQIKSKRQLNLLVVILLWQPDRPGHTIPEYLCLTIPDRTHTVQHFLMISKLLLLLPEFFRTHNCKKRRIYRRFHLFITPESNSVAASTASYGIFRSENTYPSAVTVYHHLLLTTIATICIPL